jgi:excisionase family DNA binding protein
MTDEMYTTKQAALYLGLTEADIRLAVREGKLRAWSMPLQRGLLVRKGDLMRFRQAGNRALLTHQLPLFSADGREATQTPESTSADASAA